MTIDFSALLYDPVYERLGVPATLTGGTVGEVTLTVIDDTRPKTRIEGGVETSSVGPGAFIRIPELVAKGIARDEWIGAVLTFNGRSWIAREAPVQGSPNGEDLGEVRFLLKAEERVEVDTTAPTVTINKRASQADPTAFSPILFDVVFSEAVTGFTAADISFTGSTAGGILAASISGTGPVYTVSVIGMTTDGNVVASIPAGSVTDLNGNANTISSSTDNVVAWVQLAPTVTINKGSGQLDPTSISPIIFDVVFSEAVTGFVNTDITVTFEGGGTPSVSLSGSDSIYTVEVSGMTTSGNVIASVPAGVAIDTSGNPNTISSSTDNVVAWVAPSTPQTYFFIAGQY